MDEHYSNVLLPFLAQPKCGLGVSARTLALSAVSVLGTFAYGKLPMRFFGPASGRKRGGVPSPSPYRPQRHQG